MAKKWRLILDDKCDGYYNMSVDETLLLNYTHSQIPTLRIYGWKDPCISLGYNQAITNVLTPDNNIPFVRRITGGAAILHDDELTYSITCHIDDLGLAIKPKNVKQVYKSICTFIIDFYSTLGLKAAFAKDVISQEMGNYGNFCFSSYEECDLVIRGKKIGGNAQRRKRDLIFQHGSIPQSIDFSAIAKVIKINTDLRSKVTSLDGLLGRETQFYSLRSMLADSFKRTFSIDLEQGCLSSEEDKIVNELLENKYLKTEWNNEKTIMA